MKIESGLFYRYRGSSTIYLVLHIWPATEKADARAEVVIITQGMRASGITYQRDVRELQSLLSCEVSPTWVDIDEHGECHDPAEAHAVAVNGHGTYRMPSERAPKEPTWLERLAMGLDNGEG